MNLFQSPCFFFVKAIDEAAQVVASNLSEAAASDIIEVIATSDDFEFDVGAVISMDEIVKRTTKHLSDVEVSEKFNPMFLPHKMGELDEMLELHTRHDAVRFTGMDGSPFTIKMSDVRKDETSLMVGKVQYHPFDLPSYTDLVDANEHATIN